MKNLYLTLLLFTVCTYAFAQQDFRKGYIVQNGDTLRGYVDYRGDKRSTQVTVFKQAQDSPEQRLTPEDISGYGYEEDNKIYESMVIPAVKPDLKPKALFLNALVKGEASIYYYRDADDAERYFLLMDGQPLIELIQHTRTTKDDVTGKKYNVTSNIFAGTLGNAFSACTEIKESQFKKLEFTAQSLTDITLKYNQCVAPANIVHEQKRKKSKLSVGPVVTYYSSSMDFTGDTYLNRASFKDVSANVAAGVSLNATLPRINEKLSFQLDLLYVPTKFDANLTEEGDYGYINNYDATFDLAYLKLPLQFRYTYPRGLLRPYVNAGIMVGYAVKDDNKVVKTSKRGTYENEPSTHPAIPGNNNMNGFRNLTQGLTGGAGVTYPYFRGTLTMEARYEINNGMSDIVSIGSTVSTLYILLGYSF